MNPGIFITIEGIEGAGKSTAIHFIKDFFSLRQFDVLLTREPGGTPLAEEIRELLLFPHSTEKMLPETELLLLFAARTQHIQYFILPALASGKCVISDRFMDASYAYQVGGRGLDIKEVALLEHQFVHGLKPHLTFLLDVVPEIGFQRAKSQGKVKDRIESEKIDFFNRVRKVYLERAANEPERIQVIDASQSVDRVKVDIEKILENWLVRHPHAR